MCRVRFVLLTVTFTPFAGFEFVITRTAPTGNKHIKKNTPKATTTSSPTKEYAL